MVNLFDLLLSRLHLLRLQLGQIIFVRRKNCPGPNSPAVAVTQHLEQNFTQLTGQQGSLQFQDRLASLFPGRNPFRRLGHKRDRLHFFKYFRGRAQKLFHWLSKKEFYFFQFQVVQPVKKRLAQKKHAGFPVKEKALAPNIPGKP